MHSNSVEVHITSILSKRFFERLIVGRRYSEAPYIVSRICGVCSHAHYWASNLAIENALEISVDETTATLRDVCNKLQMVENHLIHLVFMVLPDYRKHIDTKLFMKALTVRNTLNKALELVCGRLSNPQPYIPGGFTYNLPKWRLEKAITLMEEIMLSVNEIAEYVITAIETPHFYDPSKHYVSLKDWPKKSVPTTSTFELSTSLGRIVVNEENYTEIFREHTVPHSNSRVCTLRGEIFFVGARARLLASNHIKYEDLLPKQIAKTIELNPFSNLYAKAIELKIMIEDIKSSLQECLDKPIQRNTPSKVNGVGLGIIEAPRGLLIHYYKIRNGIIEDANIITPTVMFTKHLEMASRFLAELLLSNGYGIEHVKGYIEKLIRSYDPCIPCAVHIIRAPR